MYIICEYYNNYIVFMRICTLYMRYKGCVCCTARMTPNKAKTVRSAVAHSLVPHDYSVMYMYIHVYIVPLLHLFIYLLNSRES